jgi:hypothetical protein
MKKKIEKAQHYDWDAVKIDYESGLTKAQLHKKHDVPYNRLSDHAKKWHRPKEVDAILNGFDAAADTLAQLKETNPKLAKNLINIITDKHPEFKKAMVALSAKLFTRMIDLAPIATAAEIPAIAKGMQIVTDTLGITSRHGNNFQFIGQSVTAQNEQKMTKQEIITELEKKGLPCEFFNG